MIPGRHLHRPDSEASVGPGTMVRGRREQYRRGRRARLGPLYSQWEDWSKATGAVDAGGEPGRVPCTASGKTGAKPQGLFSCAV